MFVQVLPSGEVWTWYARPYAASQFSRTLVMDLVAPRSSRIHCGSAYALPQRVETLPSTAFAPACGLPDSTDDTVTGQLRHSDCGPVLAGVPYTLTSQIE